MLKSFILLELPIIKNMMLVFIIDTLPVQRAYNLDPNTDCSVMFFLQINQV